MTAPAKKSLVASGWKRILQHNDILLALGIVLVITMMLIPLPPMLLDILLTINIALSVTILLVTLYTNEPLEYSTFPTILLVSTLFRLGLNVSTTRLILLHGEAGGVVHAFGSFVIGGNYVVGVLLFIILVIINFIVITNGAGRVSEVAARFTLDAMPGKQLSIDAELNSGAIDEKEARKRRQSVQREADFYGTMDGASKFVKGDAIAAIIITVVNIVGGLIIGVMQMGMPLEQAAATFTTLSVGDGLVSQLPALIISAATGILVTRVNDPEVTLGDEIGSQMFGNPKVLGIMGGLMLVMGVTPGLPNLPFLIIGSLAAGGSFLLVKGKKEEAELKLVQEKQKASAAAKKQKTTTTENVLDLLAVDVLELEIGYRLVPLIEADSGGDLLERIAQIRRQIATELGFVLPSVRVRDNLQLPPNRYNIKLRGVTIEFGEVHSDLWLAMSTDPDITEPIQGIETKEPAFGLPALWIEVEEKEQAEVAGYTVVSASAVISTHLTEVIRKNAADILSRSDVQNLLTNVKKANESLVSDLVPDTLAEADIQLVLQTLLQEKVSVRDMVTILETLSYHCRVSKDPDYLTEQVRMGLSRSICKQYMMEGGDLPVITLDPVVEEQLAQGLSQDGKMLAVGPAFTQKLFNALNKEIERVMTNTGIQPVLLCNARLRLPFRRMIERLLPQIAVLSYNEIGPSAKVTALGSVRVE